MQFKDEPEGSGAASSSAASSSSAATSSSSDSRPPIKCMGLARHLAGQHTESWVNREGGFGFFSDSLGPGWVDALAIAAPHIADNVPIYTTTPTGHQAHLYRVGQHWCGMAFNRKLSRTEVHALVKCLLYVKNENDEDISLAFVAAHPEIWMPQTTAIQEKLDDTQKTMRENYQKALEINSKLKLLCEESKELNMASEELFVHAKNLNSHCPDWPWWLPAPETLAKMCTIL